jgi:hypothetical protein
VASRDCRQAFVYQDADSWPVLIVCRRFVVHRRCRLFRNRFAGTVWPPDLASICYRRDHIPLFLSFLVRGLRWQFQSETAVGHESEPLKRVS